MNLGYILLWRQFKDTSFFKDSHAVHVAIYLLMEANHAVRRIIFNGEPLTVQRGQVLTGRNSLSLATGIKSSTVRNKLDLLRKTGFLDIKSNNKFSIITICKYDEFQDLKKYKGQQVGQPEDNQRTTKGQQKDTPNTLKELKELKKDTEPSPVKDFIEYASSTFEDKFKVPLFIEWGKDGKLIKELLGVYEFDKLKEIWGAFLTSKDSFIEKAGRSIGVFKTQVNKLAQTKSTQREVVF